MKSTSSCSCGVTLQLFSVSFFAQSLASAYLLKESKKIKNLLEFRRSQWGVKLYRRRLCLLGLEVWVFFDQSNSFVQTKKPKLPREISLRLPNSPTQRLVCFVCYVGSHKAFCTIFSLLKVALSALVVLYRWVRELDLSPLTVSTLLKGSTPLEPRLYSLFIITGIVPMAMESDLFRTVVKLFHKDWSTKNKIDNTQ